MKEPVRVLQIFSSLDRGGAETMIMNIYKNIDREKVQFDFVVDENDIKYDFENEIEKLGGRIYRIPKYKISNILTYNKIWEKIFSEHSEWKVIHIHHTVPACLYINQANKKGIVTIVHSHTAGGTNNIKSVLKRVFRYPLRFMSEYLMSCSESASAWMFGKQKSKAIIINNSIDSKTFNYNPKIKEELQEELKINKNSLVIGHIGNFSEAKNYSFILEVFKELIRIDKNCKLILVGKFENNPEIVEKFMESDLSDNIIITGVRSDIPELLQIMDVFLFPSIYEGLPVTLIEAQSSGLKIFASDVITDEVAITDNIEFISLDNSAKYWAESIISKSKDYIRQDKSEEIISAGYDIKENAEWLQNFYLEKYKKLEK